MRFITDYHRLNQILARKPYPLPRIGETMQQLKGFKCATVLYLNMEYYTIRISPAIQYMTTIVTEFGKFKYNFLPMGMCAWKILPEAHMPIGRKLYLNFPNSVTIVVMYWIAGEILIV